MAFLLSSSTGTRIFVSYSIVISLADGIGGDLNIYTHGFLFPLKNTAFRFYEVLSPIIGTTENPLRVVSQIFSLYYPSPQLPPSFELSNKEFIGTIPTGALPFHHTFSKFLPNSSNTFPLPSVLTSPYSYSGFILNCYIIVERI